MTVPKRVFLSHTGEFGGYPPQRSFIDAAVNAVNAAGHQATDMRNFPARDQDPGSLCIERVRGHDVYVGIIGFRYGSPVRDRPDVSYTELEFEAATEARLARLIFMLAEDAEVTPRFCHRSRLRKTSGDVSEAPCGRRCEDSGPSEPLPSSKPRSKKRCASSTAHRPFPAHPERASS